MTGGSHIENVFAVACVIAFNAIIGSFLNVCIYRIPREESLWAPRSHCPSCQKFIPWYDNIPILSYLILRAKCRFCRISISPQYPAVELFTALAGWAIYVRYGLTMEGAFYSLFMFALIVLTGIDLEHQILPNVITYPLTVAGWMISFMWDRVTPTQALIGSVIGAGSLYLIAWGSELILRQEGMGLGDVKLGAAMGAWLGAKYLLVSYFLAFILGAIIGGGLILLGIKQRKDLIPFGPFLAAGAVVMVLFNHRVDEWLSPIFEGGF